MNQWARRSVPRPPSLARAEEYDDVREIRTLRPPRGWNPAKFAQEQIRSLVRQIFLSQSGNLIRHIVFTATESETDVRRICRMAGEALASENTGNVAVVGRYPQALRDTDPDQLGMSDETRDRTLRLRSSRIRSNLWLVPGLASEEATSMDLLRTHNDELRRDFDYSIAEAPSTGESLQAIWAGQLADGLILVLSASHTCPKTAFSVKESFENAQVSVLGCVLSDRVFPIPEKIYRRL